MRRALAFSYGLVSYAVFLGSFLYAIGFVGNWVVPKSIDSGAGGPLAQAILVNVLLLGLFAVQHTIMARRGFKAWWAKVLPQAIERSTFVLLASLLLCLVFWQWRPMSATVWDVGPPAIRAILVGVSLAGWTIVLYGSFLIDHFELFGLRQVFLHLRRRPFTHGPFVNRSLYRLVRHPLMTGFIIAFWATPTMTQGHLLFAAVTTAYILFGVRLEERDLAHYLGDDYRRYRERTPMLVPRLPGMPRPAPKPAPKGE